MMSVSRNIRTVLLIFFIVVSNAACASQGLQFKTVHSSHQSGIAVSQDAEYVVLTAQTQDEFDRLWQLHSSGAYPGSARPAIDFSKKTLICIVYPYRTGGVSLRVESIEKASHTLNINLKVILPKPGSMVTQALTKNTIMLVVDRTRDKVKVTIHTDA
jgi:hypothetical protein